MGAILKLGERRSLETRERSPYALDADHLTTHGVVVGMTGSGKTGMLTVLVEEALRNEVPVLVVDVKGDLPNLALRIPTFDAAALAPWLDRPDDAERIAAERKQGLLGWGIDEGVLAEYVRRTHVRVVTPGADAGELLHVLSGLERRSSRWDTDPEGARASLSAAVSLLLRLCGRDGDPGGSREHTLISIVAEARVRRGESTDLRALIGEVVTPSVSEIGALAVDDFFPPRKRSELASCLDTLLAAPSMATWRQGQSLDVGAWMEKVDGRTRPRS